LPGALSATAGSGEPQASPRIAARPRKNLMPKETPAAPFSERRRRVLSFARRSPKANTSMWGFAGGSADPVIEEPSFHRVFMSHDCTAGTSTFSRFPSTGLRQ
jgi:hypothetical protein